MRASRLAVFVTSVLLFALGSGAVSAQADAAAFNCTYDDSFVETDYEVIGGVEDATYEVFGVANGCIELLEAPADLTGPDDSADVSIGCVSGCEGMGTVTLTFKLNGIVVATCPLKFTCDENGDIVTSVPFSNPIPTVSEWGMIVLAVLLAGGAVLMLRR